MMLSSSLTLPLGCRGTVSVVPRNVLLGRLTAAPVGSLAAAVVHRNALTTPMFNV
ncbi:hypothetical protein BD779DRAFT_1549086, partial [Infundibulicybe gibba]